MRYSMLSVLLVFMFSAAPAQQPGPTRQQQAEMMRQLKLVGPGPEHKELKGLVGNWTVSMLTGDADMGFDGSANATMILGDRFLVVDAKGAPGGRDVAFRYTIGFDRRHDEYVIQNLDTTGTYPVSARGKANEGVIRMLGTDDDPMMKAMGYGQKKFAFELKITDENEFSIETIYIDTRTDPEKFRPAFRYVFQRKK